MNAENKRKLPEDAPTSFVKKKLRPLVISDDTINKRAWECALLVTLRNEVKSGNVSVKNSKRFGPFDQFFIPDDKWEGMLRGDMHSSPSALKSSLSNLGYPSKEKMRQTTFQNNFLLPTTNVLKPCLITPMPRLIPTAGVYPLIAANPLSQANKQNLIISRAG